MPAGSPEVTAMTGCASAFFKSILDIRLIAQLAQPVFVGFIEFPVTQDLTRHEALAIVAGFGILAFQHLDDMPAKW
jgi:hypothetical protein